MSRRGTVTSRMTKDDGAAIRSRAKTWSERFRSLCAMVDEADGDLQIQIGQMERAAPAAYAAFRLLEFLLQYTVIDAAGRESDGVLALLPPRLLRAVADSPLVISREHYCHILDQIAATRQPRC